MSNVYKIKYIYTIYKSITERFPLMNYSKNNAFIFHLKIYFKAFNFTIIPSIDSS